ncbi:hypothetical protein BGW38_010665 [Lunasporangiospora selenospora]|uniref:Bromo domain-containing protein n=1 Tax=Lunasporangiospora selenospora TaxID=979761 RepID=A0A9P6G478_9FUNG|nr:hypothetical protein BGW38_010665 [Lunasporangiospora selenospora]
MDREQQSEASTPSTGNESFTLKRNISSDEEMHRPDRDLFSTNGKDLPMNKAYSDNDVNETKRRRIHGKEDAVAADTPHPATTTVTTVTTTATTSTVATETISNAFSTSTNHDKADLLSEKILNTRSVSPSQTPADSMAEGDASLISYSPSGMECRSGSRAYESLRRTKRVNYADPEDYEDEIEADEYEADEDMVDSQLNLSRSRTRTLTGKRKQKSRQYHLGDDEVEKHDDDDAVEADDQEESNKPQEHMEESLTGARRLRDRSAINAPERFTVHHSTQPSSRSKQTSETRRSSLRSRYGDGRIDAFESTSHSTPTKPPQPARVITENMRITRGMRGFLAPDSPSSRNSRDITPDQPSRSNGPLATRSSHNLTSDDEHRFDSKRPRNSSRDVEGDDEGDDQDVEDDNADDDSRAGDIGNALRLNDGDNGISRMTRLRARSLAQSVSNPQHQARQRLPHSKQTLHSQSQQESDRKYDLRERPKNRPTYISDRPLPSPSPSKPRSGRSNFYNGRDQYGSRSRQSRPSFLDALLHTGASSGDENGAHGFKRRSGTAEPRNSSSRILPMNMNELTESRRDVIAARSIHMADTDPLAVGRNVDFDKVGGLDHHIKSLKEMVMLPLLYPEVYSHFQITPPRGVIFHGPPGTGKTLLARALASSCSTETQKVAFFMRKGADCLSKWVGEAERQLRLLFEEAKAWQPSIIFFDEIDGLCPVRSSKQEQIHSSIVSTMLALMDGLDGRGQVVVIGATNRIDAIDPALRRPGRFDREFYFPLPNEAARRKIIDINTTKWQPPLDEGFKDELARITTHYCGADIKALCTEAALRAIRRRYPQIYDSKDKLLIDASTIVIEDIDMLKSAKALTPATHRIHGATASPLPQSIKPLLQERFTAVCVEMDKIFKSASKNASKDTKEDDDDTTFQAVGYRSFQKLKTFKPRMLISGQRGMGQRFIGPALLQYLEGCNVQQFTLASLMSESSRTPEAACVQFFVEVKRHSPSVIYVPYIDMWWAAITDTIKATFSNLLDELNPEDGILFLATSETPFLRLPLAIKRWFMSGVGASASNSRLELIAPEEAQRIAFFEPLIHDMTRPPTDLQDQASMETKTKASPEVLKKAPPPQPRILTSEEKRLLQEHDQYVFRELRISLREIVDELHKERKFKPFVKLPEPEEDPEFYQVIKKPMDLVMISEKINDGIYLEVKDFLADINLIVENTTLYHDIQDPSRIVFRARGFQDVAFAMVDRLDPELITETEKTAARFRQEVKAQQRPQGERVSRRRLGLEAPAVPDDPEIYLRNRAALSRLIITDSTREESVDAMSIKMEEGGVGGIGSSRCSMSVEPPDNATREGSKPERTAMNITMSMEYDGGSHALSAQDNDDSGTSLSLASSGVTSASTPTTTANSGVSGTLLEHALRNHSSSEMNMDIDSSDQNTPMTTTVTNSESGTVVQDLGMVSSGEHLPLTSGTDSTAINRMPEFEALIDPSPQNDQPYQEQQHQDKYQGLEPRDDTFSKVEGAASALEIDRMTEEQIFETVTMAKGSQDGAEEEPIAQQRLILDSNAVEELKMRLSKETVGLTVEELEQLRASLYSDVWEHRGVLNKEALLTDMNKTLDSLIEIHQSLQDPTIYTEETYLSLS